MSSALFMPMLPETVVAIFAIGKARWHHSAAIFRLRRRSVAERLRDSGAKFLFTADGFYRRGQTVAHESVADEA